MANSGGVDGGSEGKVRYTGWTSGDVGSDGAGDWVAIVAGREIQGNEIIEKGKCGANK